MQIKPNIVALNPNMLTSPCQLVMSAMLMWMRDWITQHSYSNQRVPTVLWYQRKWWVSEKCLTCVAAEVGESWLANIEENGFAAELARVLSLPWIGDTAALLWGKELVIIWLFLLYSEQSWAFCCSASTTFDKCRFKDGHSWHRYYSGLKYQKLILKLTSWHRMALHLSLTESSLPVRLRSDSVNT